MINFSLGYDDNLLWALEKDNTLKPEFDYPIEFISLIISQN